MLGMTQGAVNNVLRRHRETGDTGPRPRSGRPRVTTDRETRSLVRMRLWSHIQSAPSLRSEWETAARRSLSVRTVRRRLASIGIRGYRPARVPALTRDHRRSHRWWSHDHRNWQVGRWHPCVLADESSFALYYHDGRRLVHSRQGERLQDDCVNETHGN